MRRIVALSIRRSVGALGLPALLVLVGLHIFGRARPWTHEWLWSVYQYHFLTVLLGPAAAGLAAWEGFRARRAEDLFVSAGRLGPAVVLSWMGVFIWVLIAYSAGLLTVLAIVKSSGTPGVPALLEALTLLPAFALLAAQTSTSFAVAWRLGSPLVAPAAAIAWFLVTLLLYVTGPETAIRVGGATTSLVGLRPRPDVQAAQVVFYASLTTLSLASVAPRIYLDRLRDRILRPLSLGIPVFAAVVLTGLGPLVLEPFPSRLECLGQDPVLCVAPGYVNQVAAVRAALRPYLAALEGVPVEIPRRFDQNVSPGDEAAAPLPIEIFLRTDDPEVARSTVLAWYAPSDCDIAGRSGLIQAFIGLDYWLQAEVTGERPFDPTVPEVLQTGPAREQAAWVRGAISDLQACAA